MPCSSRRSLDIVTVAGAALDQILLDNVYETLLNARRRRGDRAGAGRAARGVRGRHRVHVHAAGRGDVPQRRAADVGRRRVVARRAARRGCQRGRPRWPASRPSRRPTTQTVVVTLTQPDNDFTYRMTRRGRRRAAGRRHRTGEHAPTAPGRSRSSSGTSGRRSRSPATTTTGARRRRSAASRSSTSPTPTPPSTPSRPATSTSSPASTPTSSARCRRTPTTSSTRARRTVSSRSG